MVVCLARGADLHTAQLMPLPLTVSCFSKIQIGFTFLVPAHPGSPRKRAIKRVCVCVSLLETYSCLELLEKHPELNLWPPGLTSDTQLVPVCLPRHRRQLFIEIQQFFSWRWHLCSSALSWSNSEKADLLLLLLLLICYGHCRQTFLHKQTKFRQESSSR